MRDQSFCVMIFECFFTVVTVSCLCEETRGEVTVCVVDNAFVLFTTCFSLRHEHLLLFTLKRNFIQLKKKSVYVSLFVCQFVYVCVYVVCVCVCACVCTVVY